MKKFLTALLLLSAAAGFDASQAQTSSYLKPSEFSWSPGRKLRWADFQGPVPGGRDRVAAETACGIGFSTNEVRRGTLIRFQVYNTFATDKSWVRPGSDNAAVLEHEQGHFDICEIYTRRLRERFEEVAGSLNVNNMNREINRIYKEVIRDYKERQATYENDTRHGLIEEEQSRWTALLQEELDASHHWASR